MKYMHSDVLKWCCFSASLAQGNSQSLNHQPRSLTGTDLGPLHICDSSTTWCTCGTPGNGSRAVPGALAGPWEPIPHAGLPCSAWILGEGLGLMTIWYIILSWYPWELCPFWTETQVELIEGEGTGGMEGEEGG